MSTKTPTPPTSTLPPLSRLSTYSSEKIDSALANLRALYWPPAPPPLPKNISIPKRLIPSNVSLSDSPVSSVPDSGYASADDEEGKSNLKGSPVRIRDEVWDEPEKDPELEVLRGDAFERAFAIKWVTGFIARSDGWISLSSTHERGAEVRSVDESEAEERARVLEDATAILAAFTADGEEDGEDNGLTRTFSFALSSFNQDDGYEDADVIRVELNDAPVSNVDHTSVGLQSWGSSIMLAERIVSSPATFSLSPTSHLNLVLKRPLRILELGAGTGLLSIVVTKLLSNQRLIPRTTIVATDYHPNVLENLGKNVESNFREEIPITISRLDWEHPDYDYPVDERFDVILAADVVYHPDHARWIRNCVERLLRPPSRDCREQHGNEDKGGVFWLMIPIRLAGRHEGLHTTVDALFPVLRESHTGTLNQELFILERSEIGRQGIGRADENGYILFKIGYAH